MFKKADQDGDGKISKDELKSVLPKKGNGPNVDEIFQKIDSNQDGSIDATEHETALKQRHGPHGPPKPEELAKKLVEKADSDGDGKLSQDDLTSFLSRSNSKADPAELFKSIDTDQDGSITESELTQVFEQFRPRRHGEEQETETSESSAPQENSTSPSTQPIRRSDIRALLHAMRDAEGYRRNGEPVQESTQASAFSAVA